MATASWVIVIKSDIAGEVPIGGLTTYEVKKRREHIS
jgi:hypothetical protein